LKSISCRPDDLLAEGLCYKAVPLRAQVSVAHVELPCVGEALKRRARVHVAQTEFIGAPDDEVLRRELCALDDLPVGRDEYERDLEIVTDGKSPNLAHHSLDIPDEHRRVALVTFVHVTHVKPQVGHLAVSTDPGGQRKADIRHHGAEWGHWQLGLKSERSLARD
jgi:hypothetical protein